MTGNRRRCGRLRFGNYDQPHDGSRDPRRRGSRHVRISADDLVDAGYAWDDYIDGSYLDDDWAAIPAQRPPWRLPPWFRNPRPFGLITVAAAALVVASVLLITGSQSGEIPTTPQLSTGRHSSAAETPARGRPAADRHSDVPTAESSSSDAVETAEPPARRSRWLPAAAAPAGRRAAQHARGPEPQRDPDADEFHPRQALSGSVVVGGRRGFVEDPMDQPHLLQHGTRQHEGVQIRLAH